MEGCKDNFFIFVYLSVMLNILMAFLRNLCGQIGGKFKTYLTWHRSVFYIEPGFAEELCLPWYSFEPFPKYCNIFQCFKPAYLIIGHFIICGATFHEAQAYVISNSGTRHVQLTVHERRRCRQSLFLTTKQTHRTDKNKSREITRWRFCCIILSFLLLQYTH